MSVKNYFEIDGRAFTSNAYASMYLEETWYLNKKLSSDKKLVYQGYDANLCPFPNLSTAKQKRKDIVIEHGLEATKDFNGEVWLDDVRIK